MAGNVVKKKDGCTKKAGMLREVNVTGKLWSSGIRSRRKKMNFSIRGRRHLVVNERFVAESLWVGRNNPERRRNQNNMGIDFLL